jgi:hypothetical protein
MAHGHHRRDRSALEAGPLDVLAAIPDPAEDPADELQYMIDEYGNAVCVDERPRRIFVSAAPIADLLEPKPPGYIWASDSPPAGPALAHLLVDGKIDHHANDISERTLRPEFPIGRGGGGGNGGGVAKKRVPKIVKPRAPDREGAVLSYRVHGLTRGVKEFYRARPGEARQRLIIFSMRRHIRGLVVPGTVFRNRSADRSPLELYGFYDEELAYLKRDRSGALEELRDHALSVDGERIRYRDARDEANAALAA